MASGSHCLSAPGRICNFVCICLLFGAFRGILCNAGLLNLRMVHKFSAEAEEYWSRKHGEDFQPWPSRGSREYFQMLYELDVGVLHGRKLATFESLYFAGGNETANFGGLFGWLHYTFLDIGTPNTSFLVALDTGSDLLWVPCECKQCAPTSQPSAELGTKLNVYTPSASKTSKRVTCNNSYCKLGPTCKSKNADCPYTVEYLSANTSTSGILVEDIIYLTSGDQSGRSVTVPVTFGCGQEQMGSFLTGGAMDGLLGLGLGAISVPSFLAKLGLAKNSFSMCFQPDSSGRFFLGDKGTSNQQTTSFLALNGTYVVYMVAVDHIVVGSAAVNVFGMKMIIDTGTSFTYLPSDVYSAVTSHFDNQIKNSRAAYPPFDFCYKASKLQDIADIPSMSIVFDGGGNFSVYNPLIGLYDGNNTLEGICLAVFEGSFAILGQNFMTSYRLVFDREEVKLGWSPYDCYKLEETVAETVAPSPIILAPSPAMQETKTPFKGPSSSESPLKHVVSPTVGGGVDNAPSNLPSVGFHTRHFHFHLVVLFFVIIFAFLF